MITVRDLARKLRHYARQSPEHAGAEVMLKSDQNTAFPFHHADDTTAMSGQATVKRFLVFQPDEKGDKLHLNETL